MPDDTQINPTQSADAIRAVRERFNQAIANHDADAIAGLLAPDYHIVTGRSAQFHGADEERVRWAETFAKDSTVVYLRAPRELRVNDGWGLAEELGDWTGVYSTASGLVHASGVYVAKWQRAESGAWLVQAEVFTTLECNGPTDGCVPPNPIFP